MIQLNENAFFGKQDRYRLIHLLGFGGYSEVWLADDTQADIKVAIKVYAPGKGLDEDGVKLFSDEFSMVYNLNHANLLRPIHYDVFEQMPYLMMPYCEHGASYKQAGKINEDTAWKFLYDIASGLAYLHTQNPPVIHQNIKPANILMDADSFLITDIGISAKAQSELFRSFISERMAKSETDTIAYMSPERFGKHNMPIMAGDIWSLGATLFELMTGSPPFGEHGGLLLKGGAEIPNITGDWSDELINLVHQCLQKEPWNRPIAKTIAEQALKRLNQKQEQTVDDHVEDDHIDSNPDFISEPIPERKKSFPTLAVILLIIGWCAGFFAGHYFKKPNPKLQECISYIEQGDVLFDNMATWKEALSKYREAKEMADQNSLQLPDMQHRIERLQIKMDSTMNDGIRRAKNLFERKMIDQALAVIEFDVLKIDSEHEEGMNLKKKWEAMKQSR